MNSTSSGYDESQEMQYHPFHFALLVGFSGVATTAVILRFWARKVLKQTFKLHDYLIVLGLVRTSQSIIDWPLTKDGRLTDFRTCGDQCQCL